MLNKLKFFHRNFWKKMKIENPKFDSFSSSRTTEEEVLLKNYFGRRFLAIKTRCSSIINFVNIFYTKKFVFNLGVFLGQILSILLHTGKSRLAFFMKFMFLHMEIIYLKVL